LGIPSRDFSPGERGIIKKTGREIQRDNIKFYQEIKNNLERVNKNAILKSKKLRQKYD
jgi:hypothetical protein